MLVHSEAIMVKAIKKFSRFMVGWMLLYNYVLVYNYIFIIRFIFISFSGGLKQEQNQNDAGKKSAAAS